MPCYSTVTKTKMTERDRLIKSLDALGYETSELNRTASDNVGATKDGSTIWFSRSRAAVGEAYSTSTAGTATLNTIQRKYTEFGVREWAKKRGFSVASAEGNKLTLINRRG